MVERKRVSVDIGCGPKNNLRLYGYPEEPTVAIDICRDFLHERRNGHNEGNLVLADAQRLPIKDGVADSVFLTHTLEHVCSPYQTLAEISRITGVGSEITIAIPDPRFEGVMSKLDPDYFGDRMHRRVIPPKTLRAMAENLNLITLSITPRGFLTAVAITLSYIWHLKIARDRVMEEQSGRLIKKPNKTAVTQESFQPNSSRNFVRKFRDFYHSVEQNRFFGKLFIWNKLYPFENYLKAYRE